MEMCFVNAGHTGGFFDHVKSFGDGRCTPLIVMAMIDRVCCSTHIVLDWQYADPGIGEREWQSRNQPFSASSRASGCRETPRGTRTPIRAIKCCASVAMSLAGGRRRGPVRGALAYGWHRSVGPLADAGGFSIVTTRGFAETHGVAALKG